MGVRVRHFKYGIRGNSGMSRALRAGSSLGNPGESAYSPWFFRMNMRIHPVLEDDLAQLR